MIIVFFFFLHSILCTSLFLFKGDLNEIEIEKGIDLLGGRFSIIPRYNISSQQPNITINYDSDNTSITIDASTSSPQILTISQQVANGHILTPRITSNGDFSLAWKKDLSSGTNNGGGDSVTTTICPGDNKINVKWEDGPWVAEFNSNLNNNNNGGYKPEGLTVRVHRKVNLF